MGRTLRKHELMQRFYGKTVTTDAVHGGEVRVIPSTNKTIIDKPMKFTLGKEGVNKVQPAAE